MPTRGMSEGWARELSENSQQACNYDWLAVASGLLQEWIRRIFTQAASIRVWMDLVVLAWLTHCS